MTENLRTRNEAFENLPGFAYTPNYISALPGYDGMRMHYLDGALQQEIRGCPKAYEIGDAGHFVQEWGEGVARKALNAWSI
jgi:hypothetical protein